MLGRDLSHHVRNFTWEVENFIKISSTAKSSLDYFLEIGNWALAAGLKMTSMYAGKVQPATTMSMLIFHFITPNAIWEIFGKLYWFSYVHLIQPQEVSFYSDSHVFWKLSSLCLTFEFRRTSCTALFLISIYVVKKEKNSNEKKFSLSILNVCAQTFIVWTYHQEAHWINFQLKQTITMSQIDPISQLLLTIHGWIRSKVRKKVGERRLSPNYAMSFQWQFYFHFHFTVVRIRHGKRSLFKNIQDKHEHTEQRIKLLFS